MIRLGAAFICEAVSVRESLVSVLGGGITQIGSSSYPTPFGSHLALMFFLEGTEGIGSYAIEVECLFGDETAWTFTAELVVPVPIFDRPQSASVPLDFSYMGLPEPGRYQFVVRVDGYEFGRVPFTAFLIESPSSND